jgi:endonuclease YncB( thermonuclease family)
MRALAISAFMIALSLGGCDANPGIDAQAQASGADIAGQASVIDGDTIEIHGQRIRLSGFDTPERGKRCEAVNVYERAARELDRFIAGRTVQCASSGRDNYDRVVATCRVGGEDLGDHMVSQGWARDWPRYSHGRYASAEAEARRERRGIWGLECPDDVWSGRSYSR